MKRISLLPLALLYLTFSSAQYIDSNKDVVFQLDKPETTQIKLNGSELSFESNFPYKTRIFRSTKTGDKTAAKRDIFSFRIGLVNSNKILDVDDFDFDNYGANIQVGFKWTLRDTIYSKQNVTTGGIGLRYQFDNFKLYDPLNQMISQETPSEFSLVGNITRFFSNYRFAIALNGAYNFVTYNKTDLLSFKEVSDVISDENVVAFKKFDGRYGTLDNGLNGGRLSMAIPIFFKSRLFNSSRMPFISPAPYVSTRLTKDSKPTYNIGTSINFFGDKPFGDKLFKVPSSIGLGIDWSYLNGNWSKVNIFLSGSITLK